MSNMNKKLLLLGLVVLSIVMCTSMVSAYIAQGASPYYPWVVVGGRMATTGAFASAYMPNLIAGTYYGPGCPVYNSVSYYNAAKPCGGSWFGGYSNYGGSNYGWGGAWGGYNTYGGNVGWAAKYPSYGYNYGGYA
jgi:hypothetical protein